MQAYENAFKRSNIPSHFTKFEWKENNNQAVDSKKEGRVEIKTKPERSRGYIECEYNFKQFDV